MPTGGREDGARRGGKSTSMRRTRLRWQRAGEKPVVDRVGERVDGGDEGCTLGARVSEWGGARDSAATAVYNSGSSVALATFRVQYLSFFFFFF